MPGRGDRGRFARGEGGGGGSCRGRFVRGKEAEVIRAGEGGEGRIAPVRAGGGWFT